MTGVTASRWPCASSPTLLSSRACAPPLAFLGPVRSGPVRPTPVNQSFSQSVASRAAGGCESIAFSLGACVWIYLPSRGCARLPLCPRLHSRRPPAVAVAATVIAVTVAAARRTRRAKARTPRETHDVERRRAVSQPLHRHGQHRQHLALPAEREFSPVRVYLSSFLSLSRLFLPPPPPFPSFPLFPVSIPSRLRRSAFPVSDKLPPVARIFSVFLFDIYLLVRASRLTAY